eukprot:TRINITY_DN878_c0_g1_i6.p2 TRINITY_DN878_c0_g1~~TRINITY_DN878_c0_g1_i6.p2  ORF type:complete len:569 (+),score=213.18 TRINITY_DN878_c0_g1_i6:140-1846(+)
MLRRCGRALSTARRPAVRAPLRADEAADYEAFVQGVMAGAYGQATLAAYRDRVGALQRGRTVPNPGSLKRLLTMERLVPSPGRLLKKMVEFLTHVHKEQHRLDEGTLVVFLHAYMKRVEQAKKRDVVCSVGTKTHAILLEMHELFTWCRTNGHEVARKAWTVMVQGASVARFSTLVRYLCREMQRDGVTPDVYVASMVITSFRATKQTKKEVVDALRRETIRAWLELKALGVIPDAHCYAAMIATLNSFGDHKHAEQIYQQMLDEGHRPTVRTYTALLQGVTSPARLQQIVRAMAEAGLKVDIAAFTAVMGAMRRLYPGDTAQAEAVFRTAVQENVVLDEWAFCALLLVYRDAKDVKKAAQLMVDMINKHGIRPGHVSVNVVLETASLTAAQAGDVGSRVADWMWKYCAQHGVATHHSYGFMMKAALAGGKPAAVVSLFSSLKSTGLQVSLQHFDLLIDAYTQLGDGAAVETIQRLPHYKKLQADRDSMTEGRIARKARPLSGFLDSYAETTRPARAAKEAPPPPPQPKRDAVGVQLAAVADRLDAPSPAAQRQETQARYAIDDVLGL